MAPVTARLRRHPEDSRVVAAVAVATDHSITRFHPMMPGSSSLLLFVSAAVVLLVIPGPAVLYVTSRSIGQRRSAGFVSALGIGVGTLVHAAAAAVGLSALLMSSAIAFSAVKYLGAAYLIYLGVQKLRREESLELSQDASRTKLSRVFGQGIIVNILNPKTALFFFAFLPQFVDASRGSVALQILVLGTLFAVMGITSDRLWALFAGSVALRLNRNSHWNQTQRYVSGGMLISLGVATALAGTGGKKYPVGANRSLALLRARIIRDVWRNRILRITAWIGHGRLRHPFHGNDSGPSGRGIFLVIVNGEAGTNLGRSFDQRHGEDHGALQLLLARRPDGGPAAANHVLDKIAHRPALGSFALNRFRLAHHDDGAVVHGMACGGGGTYYAVKQRHA